MRRSGVRNSERLARRGRRVVAVEEVGSLVLELEKLGVVARTNVALGKGLAIDIAVEAAGLAVFVDHCLLGGCSCRSTGLVASGALREKLASHRRHADRVVEAAESAGWAVRRFAQHVPAPTAAASIALELRGTNARNGP